MERGRVVLSTVGHTQVDDVLILFTGRQEVAEQDMTVWLERLAKLDFEFMLVATQGTGGGMSSKQRARIAEFWKKSGREHPRIAVLTESVIQRHVATAMTWILGQPVKVFAPDEFGEAVKHLGCRASVAEVTRTVRAVQTLLDEKARLKTA